MEDETKVMTKVIKFEISPTPNQAVSEIKGETIQHWSKVTCGVTDGASVYGESGKRER